MGAPPGGPTSRSGAAKLVTRLTLLFAAPMVLFVFSNGVGLTFALFTSVIAGCLDHFRQKTRCVPYPIFLMVFYASQMSYFVLFGQIPLIGSSAASANGFESMLPAKPGTGSASSSPGSTAVAQREIKTMSIVMAAHNEHEYMARTLNSIYESTPNETLVELIIVDDGSSPPLRTILKDFPSVIMIRHEERRGLIKSKTEGGNLARGDMIMFLDAHVKPSPNWYLPILRHVNHNYKRAVVPLIPILNPSSWRVESNAVGIKMMFDWSLHFKWFDDGSDLVPCMSGGLFGISRQWWHESGEYDYEMQMWGAENIEQSIRIWLCGGEIYVARDSTIAHVFRAEFPYAINSTQITINKVRTVETWFDEYKQRFYDAFPSATPYVQHAGNLSERRKIKRDLDCKPFHWFVEKFQDVFLSKKMAVQTFLIRDVTRNLCVDTLSEGKLTEAPCQELRLSQRWTITEGRQLKNLGENGCLDTILERLGSNVYVRLCRKGRDRQRWSIASGHLRWDGSGKSLCVKGEDVAQPLTLWKCDLFLQKTGTFEKFQPMVM